MRTKLLIIAGFAIAISGSFASAQEGSGERRGEFTRELRMDCESGDDRACEHLRHMRALLRDCENGDEEDCERVRRMRALHADCENGDEQDCERLRHMWHEGREAQEREERRRYEDREERVGAAPLIVDPKVAACVAIENNYNNCIRHQHDGCPAWVVELKANHCF